MCDGIFHWRAPLCYYRLKVGGGDRIGEGACEWGKSRTDLLGSCTFRDKRHHRVCRV